MTTTNRYKKILNATSVSKYKSILNQNTKSLGFRAADASTQAIMDELEQCEADALAKLPPKTPKYKIGDMVWITGVEVTSDEYDTLIRKPVKIVGMRPIATNEVTWTLDLEDCPYMLTEDQVRPA